MKARDVNRIKRAYTETFYVAHQEIINALERKYIVIGSSGNIYTVIIGTLHRCSCYDFANSSNLCKHIMFIIIKVLEVGMDSYIVYQYGLMPSELQSVFGKAPKTWECGMNTKMIEKYNKLKNKENNLSLSVERQSIYGASCVLCDKKFKKKDVITWCRGGCGSNIHLCCFNGMKAGQNGKNMICFICKKKWIYSNEIQYKNVQG
eukprot:UN01706